jgi:hypothetical protein
LLPYYFHTEPLARCWCTATFDLTGLTSQHITYT